MNKDEIRATLDKTAELLTTCGWTQGTWARDVNGRSVEHHSSRAVSYCLASAVSRAAADRGYPLFSMQNMSHIGDVYNALRVAIWGVSALNGSFLPLGPWNDRMKTVDDVLVIVELAGSDENLDLLAAREEVRL